MTLWFGDTSVWVALTISRHEHNRASREWMDSIEDASSVVICRSTQQSLLRLLTNASVFSRYGHPPLTNEEAWQT